MSLYTTKLNGLGVSPSSVSPILKSWVTITLSDDYPEDVILENFSAVLVSLDDSEYPEYPLYIRTASNSDKTLEIKFPGAPSGQYAIQLTSANLGRVDASQLIVTTEARITGISANTGSQNGGQLLTIDGINFSDDPYDNPVQVDGYDCLVETTSPTQITCRIIETATEDQVTHNPTGLALVFLSTSEEAQADVDTAWTFSSPAASVSSLTGSYDTTNNVATAQLLGAGFPVDDLTGVTLFIDGVAQETTSVTETGAAFTITHMEGSSSDNVQIYFADGLPTGYELITSFSVTPGIVSLYPATGGAGGSLITVTGVGFGTTTEGLNLHHVESGMDLCLEVELIPFNDLTVGVSGYGSFTCLTMPMAIAVTDTIMLVMDGQQYSCLNEFSASSCFIELTESASPLVTGATVTSATDVTIAGSGMSQMAGWTAMAYYKGVFSDVQTISSDTEINISFENGIPISENEEPIYLGWMFDNGENVSIIIASYEDGVDAVSLTNPLVLGDSTLDLTCSYQGGCAYTVTAPGISSNLLDSTNTDTITVCGNTCTLDATLSDSTQATCHLPYVATTHSASNHEVVVAHSLKSEVTVTGTGPAEDWTYLVDGFNKKAYTDSTSNCYIETKFRDGYVGVLDFFKIFINNYYPGDSPFLTIELQGSNDDFASSMLLGALDRTMHEGWNMFEFADGEKPGFNSYRIVGAESGACSIGELELVGIEAIASTEATHTCDVVMTVDGT